MSEMVNLMNVDESDNGMANDEYHGRTRVTILNVLGTENSER